MIQQIRERLERLRHGLDRCTRDWIADELAHAEDQLQALEAHDVAWLIEWPASRQDVVRYWHPTEGRVIDPNHSVRFCRQADAAAVCKREHLGAGARPVEHKWLCEVSRHSPDAPSADPA